jgi:ribosomal protein S18 acetylase RimI-like enzyme
LESMGTMGPEGQGTAGLRIRPMTMSDVAWGMRLKHAAGWNQTEADWLRYLDLQPDGCFVAEVRGEALGTLTTCLFGSVAWIAMVLVEARARRCGIGTALMRHALAFLEQRKVRTVRLDATPLGQPIYEKLGFTAEYSVTRYADTPSSRPPVPGIVPLTPELWSGVLILDHVVTGANRENFLRHLFTEHHDAVRVVTRGKEVVGFVAGRPGSEAVHIGPCVARAESGPRLLADAFHRYAGQRVYLDIPTPNKAAVAAAEAEGFAVQRHLLRMRRGDAVREDLGSLWLSSGPEKG